MIEVAAWPAEPRERLDPSARTYWRVSWALGALVIVALALGPAAVLWWRGGVALAAALVLVVLVGCAAYVWFAPAIAWSHWRYELRDEDLDMQHGLWTVTRTLVPLARVQHVDTRTGPLQARFGLATLVLYTAAGASELPALRLEVAHALREQIAALAKRFDDV